MNNLFALSFTVDKDSGLALVVAESTANAIQHLRSSGRYNGTPDAYVVSKCRALGAYCDCGFGLVLETYTNALAAYDAFEKLAISLDNSVTASEIRDALGYVPVSPGQIADFLTHSIEGKVSVHGEVDTFGTVHMDNDLVVGSNNTSRSLSVNGSADVGSLNVETTIRAGGSIKTLSEIDCGGTLHMNSHDIEDARAVEAVSLKVSGGSTFGGTVNASGQSIKAGDIEVSGTTRAKGDLITKSVKPLEDNTSNIGNSSKRYKNVYATKVNASDTVNLSDASIKYDSTNNTIEAYKTVEGEQVPVPFVGAGGSAEYKLYYGSALTAAQKAHNLETVQDLLGEMPSSWWITTVNKPVEMVSADSGSSDSLLFRTSLYVMSALNPGSAISFVGIFGAALFSVELIVVGVSIGSDGDCTSFSPMTESSGPTQKVPVVYVIPGDLSPYLSSAQEGVEYDTNVSASDPPTGSNLIDSLDGLFRARLGYGSTLSYGLHVEVGGTYFMFFNAYDETHGLVRIKITVYASKVTLTWNSIQ